MCALVGREVLSPGKVPIDKCTLSSFGALCTVGKSFTITVFYHELNKVYRHIYLDWLPTSDYTLREQLTFETYINTPEKTPASELITDIYIPITKKET